MKLRTSELLRRAKARLQGHLQYYVITDDSAMRGSLKRGVFFGGLGLAIAPELGS